MKKIIISAPIEFIPDLKVEMMNEFDCTFSYQANKKETINLLKKNQFEAWMVSPCPSYIIDGELMDSCPSLKIIATPSTGSNHINIDDSKKRGIEVYTLKGTKEVNQIHASSEFTFNLMISTIRKTPYAFQAVRNGRWRESESQFRGRELDGMHLGIVGYGRIGSNLARYASAFRMNIYAYDPYLKINDKNVSQEHNLYDMISKIDVLVVCVHLNDETFKMINDDVFNSLRKGAYFINTSRGEVVDENSLVRNLQNGKIYAAGIDVISDEMTGKKSEHPLIKYAQTHENLIITPHIAGLTYDSERKAQTAAYSAIKKILINSL
tara:strand:- start:61 stop:1029 length:969 start_codon:yes stop_codon:yes gene_type:complete